MTSNSFSDWLLFISFESSLIITFSFVLYKTWHLVAFPNIWSFANYLQIERVESPKFSTTLMMLLMILLVPFMMENSSHRSMLKKNIEVSIQLCGTTYLISFIFNFYLKTVLLFQLLLFFCKEFESEFFINLSVFCIKSKGLNFGNKHIMR